MDANLLNQDNLPFRVGIYAVEGFALMSYACTVEPLRAANLLAKRVLFEVINLGSAPETQSSGASTVSNIDPLQDSDALDLLLIVAGGDPFAFDDATLFEWLMELDAKGIRIGGVSGGPVLLAKAGLLEGRRLTVHWEHAGRLAEEYPGLLIERRLYVIDRDRVTCGGGTAPLDLMHALISDQHGSAFARLVSDWFLHTDIRAATSPQRGGIEARLGTRAQPVLEAVAAMENHIADPLTLEQLALIADVSPRHLNRLCRAELHESTMDFYRALRLDTGQRLVRESSLRVADIAEATGFSSAEHFSNAYLARFGARPRDERSMN